MTRSKYSKRVREEAALLCAIAASCEDGLMSLRQIAEHYTGASNRAICLANLAWTAAYDERVLSMSAPGWLLQDVDAEAEALLRTGWEPGGR